MTLSVTLCSVAAALWSGGPALAVQLSSGMRSVHRCVQTSLSLSFSSLSPPLQQPLSASLPGPSQPDLTRESCTIQWDVRWEDLLALELVRGRDEQAPSPSSPSPSPSPSRLVLHLREWSSETRLLDAQEIARVVVCHPGTNQAVQVRQALQRAHKMFGPDRATVAQQVRGGVGACGGWGGLGDAAFQRR